DHVSDLEAGPRNWSTDRGPIVHVSKSDHSDGRAHLANHCASGWVLDLARYPLDVELVSYFQSSFAAHVQDDLPSIHRCHQPFYLDGAGLQLSVVGDQFAAHLLHRRVHSLAQDGLLEVAAAEVNRAAAPAMPVPSAAQQRRALAARLTLPGGNHEDLSGVNVDDPGVHCHDRFGLLVANSPDSVSAPVATAAANIGVLGVVTELRHAADDDSVYPEQFAQLRRGVGVGAIAVGEILLGQDLVHGFALDDRVGAILHQVFHGQVRDASADIDIAAECSRSIAL